MSVRLTFVIFALLLHGCATLDREDLKASITSEAGQAKALIGPDWPQSNPRLTTSGDLYMRNLDTQIQSLQELNSIKGNDSLLPRLAGLLYHRFQINGRLPDAEQARSLLATAHGRDHGVEVDLLYAEVLMGFHEFSMAADVLASANAANTRELAALQSRIRLATGQQTDPPDLQDRSPTGLANRANVLFDQGQMLAASRLLREAQERYRNTAPYLLSWIHLQQGIFFLRSGDYESARQFFSAARGRLPQYATAVEHLAETEFALGNNRIAAELYRSVAQQTDNPEFYYQLSRVERAEGNLPAVGRFETRAAAGYNRLLRRYPAMYADHGARYYLAKGDTDRSLQLAQANFKLRQDYSARILLLEIYRVTGDLSAACEQFNALRNAGYATPELAEMSDALSGECS